LKRHKKEEEDQVGEGGNNKLNKRGGIKSLKNATGCCMGRMDQLSDGCEGDEILRPQTFEMGVVVLVNEILKPYYH
jgi:hypothetical protein